MNAPRFRPVSRVSRLAVCVDTRQWPWSAYDRWRLASPPEPKEEDDDARDE